MQIIKEEAMKHPLFIDNRTQEEIDNNQEPVNVRLIGFGDSSVNLRANVWAMSPADAYILGCDLNKKVKERFDKEGIEIPFPYRTIVFKNKDHE
jgi:small-conductance mechanosensitive channel